MILAITCPVGQIKSYSTRSDLDLTWLVIIYRFLKDSVIPRCSLGQNNEMFYLSLCNFYLSRLMYSRALPLYPRSPLLPMGPGMPTCPATPWTPFSPLLPLDPGGPTGPISPCNPVNKTYNGKHHRDHAAFIFPHNQSWCRPRGAHFLPYIRTLYIIRTLKIQGYA